MYLALQHASYCRILMENAFPSRVSALATETTETTSASLSLEPDLSFFLSPGQACRQPNFTFFVNSIAYRHPRRPASGGHHAPSTRWLPHLTLAAKRAIRNLDRRK